MPENVTKVSIEWESVPTKGDLGPNLLRARVPGGWLVLNRSAVGKSEGIAFVPDPDHTWGAK